MNNKPTLVFQAPIATRSGYGERSRDLLRALIELDKYDIKVISTRWGATPLNALNANDLQDQEIIKRLHFGQLTRQPDIFMQVTIPNEFMPIGKYNIGVTAGIETDRCSAEWIDGCNKMNLVLVSSNHSAEVLKSTGYQMMNQQNQPVGNLVFNKNLEVLFEGIDTTIFKKLSTPADFTSTLVKETFDSIKEDFCFLFVGHWLPGDFGQDRKNVSALIRTFFESFKNKKNAPALILKTTGGAPSVMDRNELIKKINVIKKSVDNATSLPNVHIIYGDLTASEMNEVYNHPKVKAHITFTKGEGYGRPILEATISGKPVIAPLWSGQKDFLKEDSMIELKGQLEPIHPSVQWDKILINDSKWFTVDYGYAISAMKDVFKDYKKYVEKCRSHSHYSKTNFSFDKMKERIDTLMTKYIPEFPKQVSFQLPKLKKVSDVTPNNEPPKITLPKLKKIETV
jgi:glycosyltransferase involved in cell wall biosynthesis